LGPCEESLGCSSRTRRAPSQRRRTGEHSTVQLAPNAEVRYLSGLRSRDFVDEYPCRLSRTAVSNHASIHTPCLFFWPIRCAVARRQSLDLLQDTAGFNRTEERPVDWVCAARGLLVPCGPRRPRLCHCVMYVVHVRCATRRRDQLMPRSLQAA